LSSNNIQQQAQYFQPLAKKPEPLVPSMEKPETKQKSFFERIFGSGKEEVKRVDVKPVFVDERQTTEPKLQMTESKPQDAEQ
jgi:hypothetical protein